jgi:hypothetical protein
MRSAACRIWEKLSGGEGWISEVKSQKSKGKSQKSKWFLDGFVIPVIWVIRVIWIIRVIRVVSVP